MAASTPPSFLFIVNELRTNDNYPETVGSVPPRTVHGRWLPPEVARGFFPQDPGHVYRWKNGVVTQTPQYIWDSQYRTINGNSTEGVQWPEFYRAATVFYCNGFDHFFTARGDASAHDIASPNTGPEDTWQPLTFLHANNNISWVDHGGDQQHLAVRQASWIEQLLPNSYRRLNRNGQADGGLAGLLPIVIALVAFSCQNQNELYRMLVNDRSWRGHRWVPHQRETGRVEGRGMVVSVYRDNIENPLGSTIDIIRNLEFGPTPIFR